MLLNKLLNYYAGSIISRIIADSRVSGSPDFFIHLVISCLGPWCLEPWSRRPEDTQQATAALNLAFISPLHDFDNVHVKVTSPIDLVLTDVTRLRFYNLSNILRYLSPFGDLGFLTLQCIVVFVGLYSPCRRAVLVDNAMCPHRDYILF